MDGLASLTASLPTLAKDIALNLEAALRSSSLSVAQGWGVAVASAALDEPGRLQSVDEPHRAGMSKPKCAPDRVDGLTGVVGDCDDCAGGTVVQARRGLGACHDAVGKRECQRAEHVQGSGVGSIGHEHSYVSCSYKSQ